MFRNITEENIKFLEELAREGDELEKSLLCTETQTLQEAASELANYSKIPIILNSFRQYRKF